MRADRIIAYLSLAALLGAAPCGATAFGTIADYGARPLAPPNELAMLPGGFCATMQEPPARGGVLATGPLAGLSAATDAPVAKAIAFDGQGLSSAYLLALAPGAAPVAAGGYVWPFAQHRSDAAGPDPEQSSARIFVRPAEGPEPPTALLFAGAVVMTYVSLRLIRRERR